MAQVYELAVRMQTAMAMLRSERGQGTVEYVGLILMIAGVLGAVIAFGGDFEGAKIGSKITNQLEKAINGLGGGK
jgi:hypothetical protein